MKKFILAILSIMFGECVVIMSISDVYSISKTSSVLNRNILLSWCLWGLRSNFLYSSSNEFMYHCRWFSFEIYIMCLPLRLFVCPVLSFNRYITLRTWIALISNSGSNSHSPRQNEITRSCALGTIPLIWGLMVNNTSIWRSNSFSIFM